MRDWLGLSKDCFFFFLLFPKKHRKEVSRKVFLTFMICVLLVTKRWVSGKQTMVIPEFRNMEGVGYLLAWGLSGIPNPKRVDHGSSTWKGIYIHVTDEEEFSYTLC